jgi:hypothetical protein
MIAATPKRAGTGTVISRIFYLQFQIVLEGGKTFNGKVGDIASPAGGSLVGDLYTNDLDRLYRDTVNFEFQSTSVYTSLVFFDGKGILLGHFQAGPLSSIAGMGTGSGSWS